MKLLHTADLHLGAPFVSLGERGEAQRAQLLATFDAIVELALAEEVDAVLVAGDLFDSNNPSPKTLDRVTRGLSTLAAACPVFLLPGTHDCAGPSSLWPAFPAPPGLHVFLESGALRLPELDATVHALVIEGRKARAGALSRVRPDEESSLNIGLAHGSLAIPGLIEDDHLLISSDDVAATGMDYLALGHWHSFRTETCGEVVACYPGAPEMLAKDQRGAGQAVLVTLEAGAGARVEPRTVGRRRFDSMKIGVEGLGSIGQLEEQIAAKADPDLVLDVTLDGLCSLGLDIDTEELVASLADSFFVLTVRDETHPTLQDVALADLSPETVAGRFAENMSKRIEGAEGEEKSVYEEALRLGVALLQDRQVLG